MLAGFADNWYIFSASSAYTVQAAKVGDRIMDGDFEGAMNAFGRSWWEAIRDPMWYFQIITSVAGAGGRVPKPGARPLATAARELTPAQMGAHLTTTWEANPILQRTAQARAMARTAPAEVIHREYVSI